MRRVSYFAARCPGNQIVAVALTQRGYPWLGRLPSEEARLPPLFSFLSSSSSFFLSSPDTNSQQDIHP